MNPLLLTALIASSAPDAGPTREEQPLSRLPDTPSLDLTAMDRSVDPCVDFYSYSCRGWEKANPIPADQPSWSVYGKLQDDTQRYLWGVLRDVSVGRVQRSPAERKIGDAFAACTDEPAVEALGARPIRAELAAIGALASKKALPAYLGSVHGAVASSGMLFGFGSEQDASDATQVIAVVGAGGLGLPDRDYYVKDDPKSVEIRVRYVHHVEAMLRLAGTEPAGAAADGAKQVLRLETELARASLTRVERRDPYKVFHKTTRVQLASLTPGFDWNRYLTAMKVPRAAAINVQEPAFFTRVGALIGSEPLEIWKTYLRWHLIAERAPYLSSAFVREDFAFNRAYLRGVEEMPPRWKRCVRWIDRDLGEALGQVFVARTFSADTKARTLTMVRAIQREMERDLQTLPWMGAETRRYALEKLARMANKIGYPERWRNYDALAIRRSDFHGNIVRGLRFENARQLAKIGKPVDRGEWQMTAQTVNAYYDPLMNDMNFPAAVLIPPLFDPKSDDAPNYGNTGGTVGHELTHGFDDEGRQFDAFGNLKDWWTAADAKEFERRASCVSDQYSQYVVVDDIRINGRLTLGEDVADLGGLILAYRAWQAVTRDQKLQPQDGFTPEQRFFIGFAQWDCNNVRPENERVNATINPHSPGRYRINGVVVNMPEFVAAFACKPGQPMTKPPEKVCRVW